MAQMKADPQKGLRVIYACPEGLEGSAVGQCTM